MKKRPLITLLLVISVSFSVAQTAYITNYSGTVSVIDVSTNTVTSTIPIAEGPSCVSVSPDGSKVYTSNEGINSVSVINGVTNTVSATIPFGSHILGIWVSPDGRKVYVANEVDSTISVINTATNTVVDTILFGSRPGFLVVSPDGSKVYVGSLNDTSVCVMDTISNSVVAIIPVANIPYGIIVSPDGSKVYVANYFDNSVCVINTISNTVSNTITVGFSPFGITISPDGSKVYVTNNSDNTVSVINTATNSVSNTISVGDSPIGISASPDGSKVYVVNSVDSTVSVINTATNIVSATIPVGSGATGFGNFISSYANPCTPTNIYQTLTLCVGQTLMVGLNTYDSTGIYTDILTKVNGCDSIIYTNLAVETAIDVSTTLNGLTLSANLAGATYQWLYNCPNYTAIVGATNQSYTVLSNGNYAVVVTVGNCSDTSLCDNINIFEVSETLNINKVVVWPNPTNSIFSISGVDASTFKSVEIIDLSGAVVLRKNSFTDIDISSLSNGFYFYKVIGDETFTGKIVKQ